MRYSSSLGGLVAPCARCAWEVGHCVPVPGNMEQLLFCSSFWRNANWNARAPTSFLHPILEHTGDRLSVEQRDLWFFGQAFFIYTFIVVKRTWSKMPQNCAVQKLCYYYYWRMLLINCTAGKLNSSIQALIFLVFFFK